MQIVKKSDQNHRQLVSQKTGEQYSRSCVLSEMLGSHGLFLSHEIIQTGSRSSAPHFHTETDELIVVISGELVAVEGDEKYLISAGDTVQFEAGSEQRHFLKNESEHLAEVLVIRNVTEAPDVVF